MLIETLLIGMGGWRLAALASYERGPFDIFLRLRELIGFKHSDVTGEPVEWADNFLTGLVSCIWCASTWTIALMYGVWQIEPVLVMLMAAMAIPPMIEKWAHP